MGRVSIRSLSRPTLMTFSLAPLLVTACIVGDAISDEEKAQAISAAERVYAEAEARGVDFSDGPCIAEQLDELPDWSVDIAHKPRQKVDDQASNQCQAYRDGTTHHFVELDPMGDLIRAK